MTEAQTRSKFAAYFLDLQEQQRRDGASVSKATEWEFFIAAGIDEGDLPEQARSWKCPRSLKNI
jgi:hypothetical protein